MKQNLIRFLIIAAVLSINFFTATSALANITKDDAFKLAQTFVFENNPQFILDRLDEGFQLIHEISFHEDESLSPCYSVWFFLAPPAGKVYSFNVFVSHENGEIIKEESFRVEKTYNRWKNSPKHCVLSE